MAKKSKSKGFWWGLLLGLIIAAGAVYYYQNYYNERKMKRNAHQIEKDVKKKVEDTTDKAKKLFE